MNKKVLLILCDGMRPDALEQLNHPFYAKMKEQGSCCINAKTVFPSVTLPCHVSLFHSVEPQRHGTTTNIYMPQVRPIDGLCEQLKKFGKKSAMFYNWEELKDLTRPDSMLHTYYASGHFLSYGVAQKLCVENALSFLPRFEPDFTFLYFGEPDAVGHNVGWMTEEYMQSLNTCWDFIEKICNTLGEEYTVIVTADHGGHDRTHGYDIPEDMLIPVITNINGLDLSDINIIDIAPSVCKLLGVPANEGWEGKAFV